MDLSRRLGRWTLARPRVLLVESPGSRRLRWQVEAELDRRHWPHALSPADTDLLLVLGTPGPHLAAAVDLLWSQTTSPRRRHEVGQGAHVPTELDLAVRALDDVDPVPGLAQLSPAELLTSRTSAPPHGDDQHQGHEEQAGSDAHEGHHMHHGGDVAGLAMAGTAPDRDGLELDSLQVTLGPVLPGWPAGLVVRGQLQGDVLTGVEVAWADKRDVDGADDAAAGTADVVALDHLARFLLVAGWPAAARSARTARSALLSPEPDLAARGRCEATRLARRVRRSRTLAWSVRGLGMAASGTTGSARTTALEGRRVDGDVLSRVHHWCELAGGDASPQRARHPGSLAEVADLLDGAELAAARLIVASVELDLGAVGGREAAGV